MRQQIVQRTEPKHRPVVIDQQGAKRQVLDRPVRTVIYVEVGGMDPRQVAMLAAQFAAQYEGSPIGTHYVVPVRGGRLNVDIEFEAEFMATINRLCEVRDGEIVLREGAQDVKVLRQHILGEEE